LNGEEEEVEPFFSHEEIQNWLIKFLTTQ
jgi:hypothetical protein